MKRILFTLVFIAPITFSYAQKLSKSERQLVNDLKNSIQFLADDKLEGRRAGTHGEMIAADYIMARFKTIGLQPKGDNGTFLQAFEIKDGKVIKPSTFFKVNGKALELQTDFFPLAFSANGAVKETTVATSLSEDGVPWFKDIEPVLDDNKHNPHFDIYDFLSKESKVAATKGATAMVFYNSGKEEDEVKFNNKDKSETLTIPVLYLTRQGRNNFLGDASAMYEVSLQVGLGESDRTGHNVVGYINNKAKTTVVIGAHYDHLGYGEDGNSMIRSGPRQIHNGADDNASGTAALIELAKRISRSKWKNNNYLFIAFSGEELGLFGSKYFTDHPTIDLASVNYMINMDMVGRLNDSSKVVTIGGYGTSPTWSEVLFKQKKLPFSIKTDSSGTGPSDHTSFYLKNIPVLFFFTGLHHDYHKPSDDADKINYKGEAQIIKYIIGLVKDLNRMDKLTFLRTKDRQTSTSARFTVSLGVMPDYTFDGAGLRVDDVSEGKAAKKAGVQAGDIIIMLGEYPVNSMESYMQALSKFKGGDSTTVKVKRGNEELTLPVTFVK